MTITEAVRDWLEEFPQLSELHIDLTEESDGSCGLERAGDKVVKEYVDGTELRTALFYLYFRDATDFDVQRLENCQFCQNLIFWVTQKCHAEELPELPPPCAADSVTAENGRLLYYDDTCTSGVYQIAIEVTYFYTEV